MIIDAHCHAWDTWPYDPPVPDPATRGSIEQLIFELDQNSVDRAFVVCAEIEHNPDNNDYVYEQSQIYSNRIIPVVDVDSKWKPTYHTTGAVDRLANAIERWQPVAFTHYIGDDVSDGEWLMSDDGLAMFELAKTSNLIASIHCRPQHQPYIRQLASQLPDLVILLHHMGHPKLLAPETLHDVLLTAPYDNVYVKVSGFYNATTAPQWDYPLADVQPIVHALYQKYGGERLLWGSDYPVCRRFFSYRHAMEILRRHCRFVSSADMDAIMGDSLQHLLSR